jgi:hypothetical protein
MYVSCADLTFLIRDLGAVISFPSSWTGASRLSDVREVELLEFIGRQRAEGDYCLEIAFFGFFSFFAITITS